MHPEIKPSYILGTTPPDWISEMIQNGELILEQIQNCKTVDDKGTESIKRLYRLTSSSESKVVFEGITIDYRYNTKNQCSDIV